MAVGDGMKQARWNLELETLKAAAQERREIDVTVEAALERFNRKTGMIMTSEEFEAGWVIPDPFPDPFKDS